MASNTSSAVKNRWNKEHYKSISVMLDIDLVKQWEEKIKADGISKAEFVRNAINSYLGK